MSIQSRYQIAVAQLAALQQAIADFRGTLTGIKYQGSDTVKHQCPHCYESFLEQDRRDWISTADVDRWLQGASTLAIVEDSEVVNSQMEEERP